MHCLQSSKGSSQLNTSSRMKLGEFEKEPQLLNFVFQRWVWAAGYRWDWPDTRHLSLIHLPRRSYDNEMCRIEGSMGEHTSGSLPSSNVKIKIPLSGMLMQQRIADCFALKVPTQSQACHWLPCVSSQKTNWQCLGFSVFFFSSL